MGRFITNSNTESKKFVNDAIQIYTDNKVGQYSKYLSTSQFFVTYFSINQALSRADNGTGNIQIELGPNSPLRYNQIDEFPVYNLPEIKPELVRDERGANIELTLNDITILPNTIKPQHSDYVLISLPNMKQLLFRVTEFQYNSIQSNDFYTINLELRNIGDDVYKHIEQQVVEKYVCIFENIGTQDKCLIKVEDVSKILDLEAAIIELKQLFKDLYYNEDCGVVGFKTNQVNGRTEPDIEYSTATGLPIVDKGFAYYHSINANTSLWAQSTDGYIINDIKNGFSIYYDLYATKFMNDSKIFDGGVYSDYMYQIYDDRLPTNFDQMYRKSLWYALMNRNLRYLSPELYYFEKEITQSTSLLVLMNYDAISIMLSELKGITEDKFSFYTKYFSNALITTLIKLRDSKAHPQNNTNSKLDGNTGSIENQNNNIFDSALVEDCLDETTNNIENELIELPELTYIETMIRDYFFWDPVMTYDLQSIINEIIEPSLENYHKLLIVIYILFKIHDSYFDTIELNNEEKGRLSKWEKITHKN